VRQENGPGAVVRAEGRVNIAGQQSGPNNTIDPVAPLSRHADALLRVRRQRHTAQVHALGARVTFEIFDEIARHHPEIADDLDLRLARYAGLDLLVALGADKFPSSPIRAVSP
jgi:hypothetical protein